jgi:deoxyribodipyrimidine photolyase-related protein
MSEKILIILPHQLYDKKYLPTLKNNELKQIILYEHPQYYTKYNYNKKRIILNRASMKYYYDYLKSNGYNDVKYIQFNETLPKFDKAKNNVLMFDPIDKLDTKSMGVTELLDTPNFLLSNNDLENYRKKTDKFFFNAFYMWGKQQPHINIIPKLKSLDKENRNKIPESKEIPKLPKPFTVSEKKYINEAIQYTEKYFSKNYGNTNNFNYPITHTTTNKWLNDFIKKRFDNFGKYQDAILDNESYLFHSILSSSINLGLIQPSEIIDKIRPLLNKINKASYEGYIRQLFWREYQRLCYKYFDFNKLNYFKNNTKLNKSWYNGTTGILPVDNAIKQAFDTGYLHHIMRLMVIGNWMMLSGIKPMEGLRWFMEFSCDSYEWVMYQNVLDMVFCVSGGKTMRKVYISSSNYILKMSNYKKNKDNKEWIDKWDKQYRKFLLDKEDLIMSKFSYTFARVYKNIKK